MFWDQLVALCVKHDTNPNRVAKELGYSSATATSWKHGAVPRDATLKKIADYFNVTTDYLLGRTHEPAPVSDDDIKFALFGGEQVEEITDEMYQQVKDFVAFLKNKKKKG